MLSLIVATKITAGIDANTSLNARKTHGQKSHLPRTVLEAAHSAERNAEGRYRARPVDTRLARCKGNEIVDNACIGRQSAHRGPDFPRAGRFLRRVRVYVPLIAAPCLCE